MLVLGGHHVDQVADHCGQLFVNGGKRRAQLVGDLRDELGLQAVQNLQRRDVHEIDDGPEALLAVPQHRLPPGAQVLAAAEGKFVNGDVAVIQVLALRNVHDQGAEGFIRQIRGDRFSRSCLRAQRQELPAGRVDQHHMPGGVGDQNPVRQGFDDGVDAAFFRAEIGQRPAFFLLEEIGLPCQPDPFGGAVDHDPELVGLERLGHEVIGAALHGLDGGVHRRITGDDDGQDVRVQLPDVRQDLHAVLARHLEVQQNDFRPGGVDELQRVIAAGGREHVIPHPLQDPLGAIADVPLVIGHQDSHCCSSRRFHYCPLHRFFG